MPQIAKTLGGSGSAAVATTSLTVLLVIVATGLRLTLTELWMLRDASCSSDDATARRITWMQHGHEPNDRPGRPLG